MYFERYFSHIAWYLGPSMHTNTYNMIYARMYDTNIACVLKLHYSWWRQGFQTIDLYYNLRNTSSKKCISMFLSASCDCVCVVCAHDCTLPCEICPVVMVTTVTMALGLQWWTRQESAVSRHQERRSCWRHSCSYCQQLWCQQSRFERKTNAFSGNFSLVLILLRKYSYAIPTVGPNFVLMHIGGISNMVGNV